MRLLLTVLLFVPAPQDPTGRVWALLYEKDAVEEHERGIRFHMGIEVRGYDRQKLVAVVRFSLEKFCRDPIADRNGEYALDGAVALTVRLVPGLTEGEGAFLSFTPFLPYDELHLEPGMHTVFYEGTVRRENGEILPGDPYRGEFEVEIAGPRGEVRLKSADERFIVAEVSGRSEAKARLVARFYDPGKLTPVFLGGVEAKGPVAMAEFLSLPADRKEVKLAVPRDDFALRRGRNAFAVKVWLEIEDGGGWRVLDATCAQTLVLEHGQVERLPEVWVVPVQKVCLDWEPSEAEWAIVRETLVHFNRRLYDATDGQIRIAKFQRVRKAKVEHDDGFLYVIGNWAKHFEGTETDPNTILTKRAFSLQGTPNRPKTLTVPFELFVEWKPESYSAVVLHEFGHSRFGLSDEYGTWKDDAGNLNYRYLCPGDEEQAREWSTCFMCSSSPEHREFCHPKTHRTHPDHCPSKNRWKFSEQHPDDCWTRIRAAVKKDGHGAIVIPEWPQPGPDDPREPEFEG